MEKKSNNSGRGTSKLRIRTVKRKKVLLNAVLRKNRVARSSK